MENLIIVLIILILVILGILTKKIFDFKNQDSAQGFLLLQNQLNELVKTLDRKMGESTEIIHRQMTEGARLTKDIIREVTQEITKLTENQKQVLTLSEQLKTLEDILRNPKQRGIIGEYLLENTLKNTLPPTNYQMQYRFQDGTIVDAVIFYQDKIIPIDSKFSLENYNRWVEAKNDFERQKYEEALRNDLKTRIDEVAKYIKPDEDTIDIAIMYIPSEAVYYDMFQNKIGSISSKSLIEYAYEKKVSVVSPNSFQAFLTTILLGLRQIEISQSIEKIRKNIARLSKHLTNYEIFLKKLGNHLNTALSTYNKTYEEFQKIDKDIYKITGQTLSNQNLLEEPPLDSD